MAPKATPSTTAGTREVAANAGPLDISEVTDDRDVTPREAETSQEGEFLKASPARGATTLVIPSSDFYEYGGISHEPVTFDFRNNEMKVPIGTGQLSEEAAEFLVKRYPDTFEYVTGG